MHGSINSNHTPKSHFAEQVAAQKSDVQSFFNDNWSRLRTLIMELEEDSWSDNGRIEPVDITDGAEHITAETTAQETFLEQCRDNRRTGDEQEPPVRDRLAELAAQIEWRLESANGSGR